MGRVNTSQENMEELINDVVLMNDQSSYILWHQTSDLHKVSVVLCCVVLCCVVLCCVVLVSLCLRIIIQNHKTVYIEY